MNADLLVAVLAGATGLVGGECLKRLIDDARYERVIVVTRRDIGQPARHPKVRQHVTEFGALGELRDKLRAHHVFCALGTTIRKAGSQKAFRAVDYEYPLALAQRTRILDATHFSIISAMGANPRSPFFYSRVKGDVEQALRRMQWPSLAILRPSLIAGQRTESRPVERLAEGVLRFAPAAWKPVAASEIAAAMVAVAAESPPGVTVIESSDIAARAERSRA
jgi:uncharacterized protein YbjT (DUF2867 family)